MSDFKDCPFLKVEKDIGHEPYTIQVDGFWYVQCTCGARGSMACAEDYAIKLWGIRVNDISITECIEMVEDEMHEDLPSYDSLIMKFNKLRDA